MIVLGEKDVVVEAIYRVEIPPNPPFLKGGTEGVGVVCNLLTYMLHSQLYPPFVKEGEQDGMGCAKFIGIYRTSPTISPPLEKWETKR
jgi:hypothetical protein